MRPEAAPAATASTKPSITKARSTRSGPSSCALVGITHRAAAGLDGVPGVGVAAAEVRAVVRVGDVRPAGRVGVDAEVVEQLSTAVAADAALAHLTLVHRDDPCGR